MARRKKNSITLLTLLVTMAGVYCFGQMITALLRADLTVAPFVLIGIAAFVVVFFVIPWMRRKTTMEMVDAVTDEKIEALARQRRMLLRDDPYGKPITDKWQSELTYFVTHHVRPRLSKGLQQVLERDRSAILQRIENRVVTSANQRPELTALSSSPTSTEFEAFCAQILRVYGWEVWLTPPSRDQGVDVIAEKNGVRVVLQCKLYSNPVGNKAVQEVAAGRVHQQAHYGAVVTNNTYTSPAKELASTNGIRLLHHTDLPQLEQILKAGGLA